MLQGDGDGEVRKVVEKICCPIQGIDDPDKFITPLLARLFCKYAVIGIRLMDRVDDYLLRPLVDLGDEIVVTFGSDVE